MAPPLSLKDLPTECHKSVVVTLINVSQSLITMSRDVTQAFYGSQYCNCYTIVIYDSGGVALKAIF